MHRPALTIRPARRADAPVLAQAQRAIALTPGLLASQPEEITDERIAQKIELLAQAGNGCFLVAEAEQHIVGHGLLDPLPLAALRHVVHLTLVTHLGWQSRGVGRTILANLIAWARAAPNVGKIELNVRAPNQVAQGLYRKQGFIEIGRWQRRIQIGPDRFVDDVCMELLVK
jgi:putative acetyltransferase